jgi:ribonuclease HI
MTLHIHCDGSCFHLDGRMGMGAAFFENDAEKPFHVIRVSGKTLGSNNEAEYLAVRHAMSHLHRLQHEGMSAIIYSDSELVINQLKGLYQVRDAKLFEYYKVIKAVMEHIKIPLDFVWVPRTNPRQKIVDKLSKQANPYFQHRKLIKIKE